MSLDINQIALHQLIKRDEQNLELVLRDSLLEPTATVVDMMAELHRVYSAKNKAYGCLAKRVNWHKRCVYSVRAKRIFWHLVVPRPDACGTSWRNILLPTAALSCSAITAIWR